MVTLTATLTHLRAIGQDLGLASRQAPSMRQRHRLRLRQLHRMRRCSARRMRTRLLVMPCYLLEMAFPLLKMCIPLSSVHLRRQLQ